MPDNLLHFSVTGEAKIIGVGNGDPSSHEPDQYIGQGWQRHLFNGKCQVIIQSGGDPRSDAGARSDANAKPSAGNANSGDVLFRAEGEGLQSGTATIHEGL